MTAKPNLWVVLVTTPNWITGMRDLKCFTTEQSAKSYVGTLNSYAPPLIVEYAPVEKRENATERAARLGFNLESATGENIDVITGKRFDDE